MASGATRGQPSGGQAPSIDNYTLGNDPNWLKSFSQQGQGLSQQGQQLGQQGQATGAWYGGSSVNRGDHYADLAAGASQRTAPTTQYGMQQQQLQNTDQQGGAAQYGLAQQLAGMAAAPQGPSAAQAQLQKGTDAALNSQLAMARSGSGFGENANALSQAGAQASQTIADQGNNSAMLRAQEDQNYRAQQAQDLGLAGQQLGAARGADQGLAGQLAQQTQFGTNTSLQQQGMNDQRAQGLNSDELNANQQTLQGYQFGQQSAQDALTQQQQQQQLQLQAAQAQQQGTMGYEGDLNNIYSTDQQHNTQSRQLDQQRDKDRVSGVSSAIGSVIGGIVGSDRRMKRKIRDASLDQLFRDLGGDERADELSEGRARRAA